VNYLLIINNNYLKVVCVDASGPPVIYGGKHSLGLFLCEAVIPSYNIIPDLTRYLQNIRAGVYLKIHI